MANKKITELNELIITSKTDVLPIVDIANNETKKITGETLKTLVDTQFQNSTNKAVFNGSTSQGVGIAFAPFAVNTIYLEIELNSPGVEVINQYSLDSNIILFVENGTDISIRSAAGVETKSLGSLSPGINKIIFRWNATTYDIFVNGIKTTITANTSFAGLINITQVSMGFRETNNTLHFDGSICDNRISNATLTEVECLDATSGLVTIDSVLPDVSNALSYHDFDATATITNKGGYSTNGDLTATDVVKGNVTEFSGPVKINGIWY